VRDKEVAASHYDRMQDQAIAWIARLRSDSAGDEDFAQFALWLSANPEHRRAVDAMLEMWDDLGAIRHLPLPATRAAPARRRWIAGLAVAATVVMAVLLTPGTELLKDQQIYRTRTGEQLAVELADGSNININTNSQLQVALDRDARRVVLSQGEAFFKVASDPKRPFIVEAGNAEIRALGTAFNIYLHEDVTEVTVTEGVVRVTELNAPLSRPPSTALLYADQSLMGSAGGLAAIEAANSSVDLAWRDGKIVADGMKLSELVLELSRYHHGKILIADPGIGQMTVSGVFRLDDPDTIIRALEQSLDIRSVALDDGSIQLLRAPL
jgi:transmembrane sensor